MSSPGEGAVRCDDQVPYDVVWISAGTVEVRNARGPVATIRVQPGQ